MSRCRRMSCHDVEKYWKSEIKDANGKPLFAMTN